MRFLAYRQRDGLVEALGQVLPLALQDVGQRLPQGLRRLPHQRRILFRVLRQAAEQAAGNRVRKLHALLPIHHQHRIGEGVDRGLAGLLRRISCAWCDC